jgi:hypothetical protein
MKRTLRNYRDVINDKAMELKDELEELKRKFPLVAVPYEDSCHPRKESWPPKSDYLRLKKKRPSSKPRTATFGTTTAT